MIFRNSALLTVIALSACAATPQIQGQHWQRAETSEAVYQQGPKAQQMLDRDIGRCVVELQELEKLGSLKDAIDTDSTGKVLDPDEKPLEDVDTPDFNAAFFAKHGYHNFEGCMMAKGWERVYAAGDNLHIRTRGNALELQKSHNYSEDSSNQEYNR